MEQTAFPSSELDLSERVSWPVLPQCTMEMVNGFSTSACFPAWSIARSRNTVLNVSHAKRH